MGMKESRTYLTPRPCRICGRELIMHDDEHVCMHCLAPLDAALNQEALGKILDRLEALEHAAGIQPGDPPPYSPDLDIVTDVEKGQ